MEKQNVIDVIATAVKNAPNIRALFLSGSYGNGLADIYSDIDFLLVVEGGASDQVSEIWREAIGQTGEIVLWWQKPSRPHLINAITADWTRTDVVIRKPDQLGSLTQAELEPLFDHDNIYARLPDAPEERSRNPARLKFQFEEFIRILGLLHLAAGREEYINGVLGVFHLRNLLVELLIEEMAAPNRGGVLHLNRLISDEQKELLISLPPALPDRESIISTHLAYAHAYLPRARRLAAQWGIEWPERFEAATWEHLRNNLSIECPYVR
ncbi:MAG: nucleotidyltransferase domain-containing protein [Hyphomicrobiaceae bacterium]